MSWLKDISALERKVDARRVMRIRRDMRKRMALGQIRKNWGEIQEE